MRLWLMGEMEEIESGLKGLIRVMVDRAELELEVLMPGYTHLQVRYANMGTRIIVNVSYSAVNPLDGPTSFFHTPFRLRQISSAFSS